GAEVAGGQVAVREDLVTTGSQFAGEHAGVGRLGVDRGHDLRGAFRGRGGGGDATELDGVAVGIVHGRAGGAFVDGGVGGGPGRSHGGHEEIGGLEFAQAVGLGGHDGFDGDAFAGVGADLGGGVGKRAGEQRGAVEGGGLGHAVELV